MDQEKLLDTILYKIISIEEKIDEKMVTKEELSQTKNELMTHIDGFIKLHQTLDQELVVLRHKYDQLETRLARLEQKFALGT